MMNNIKFSKPQAFFLTIMLAYFTPSVIHNVRFQLIKNPLTIQLHLFEPPKMAFQEALQNSQEIDFQKEWESIGQKPTINLNEFHLQRKKWNPEIDFKSQRYQVQAIHFNGEDLRQEIQKNEWVNELPQHLKTRLERADEKNDILQQDWSIPSFQDLAQKTISENNGQKSFVFGFQYNPSADKVSVYRQNADGSRTTRKDIMTAASDLNRDETTHAKITGQIQLYDGLALGDRYLKVKRVLAGVELESADPNLQNGTFQLNTEEKKGSLVAELIEKTGEVVASGKIKIEDTSDNVRIAIRDNHIFSGTFYDFNKSPEKLMSEKFNSMRGQSSEYLISTLQSESKTDASGSFKIDRIAENSVTLLRARSARFSEVISMLISGEDQNIPLYSESLIAAAKSLSEEKQYFQNSDSSNSVVWGQVLYDGKPLSDVQVKLLHSDERTAIYLNGWLPDLQAKSTLANGYFYFVNVPKGMQTFIVEKNGIYIGHGNIEVDDNTTSTVLIEISSKQHPTAIRLFDFFTGETVQGNIQLQSFNTEMQINGEGAIYLQDVHRYSFGYFSDQNQNYQAVQFSYFDRDEAIEVPLIKTSVLFEYATRARINYQPDRGVIIGSVIDQDYDLYLPHEENFNTQNIIYFDSKGNITESGVGGGGFIIYNVPPKTQGITVVSKHAGVVSSKIIPVEPNTTSVLKFHF